MKHSFFYLFFLAHFSGPFRVFFLLKYLVIQRLMNAPSIRTIVMKHSPTVRTHQMEASHARVLLDTRGMEPQERVLVSDFKTRPKFVFLFC